VDVAEQLADFDTRLKYQEQLHRNVAADGNIRHTWDVLPVLIVAVAAGVSIGIILMRIKKQSHE